MNVVNELIIKNWPVEPVKDSSYNLKFRNDFGNWIAMLYIQFCVFSDYVEHHFVIIIIETL